MSSPFISSTHSKEYRPQLQSLRDDIKARKDPDFFWQTGTQVYVGRQGSGKTISAVHHVSKLKQKYPKSVIVSNLDLADLNARKFLTKQELIGLASNFNVVEDYIYFQDMQTLSIALTNINNDRLGVIYLIDEIHNYFHSHDSRSIPLWVVQVFSQQRKNRVLVIGTVQLWDDVTKVIRDQIENLIECKKIMGIIFNKVLDPRDIDYDYGQRKIRVKKLGFYIPNKKLYESYDTYQIINSGRNVFGGSEIVRARPETKKEG